MRQSWRKGQNLVAFYVHFVLTPRKRSGERRFLQNVSVWNCVIAQGRGKDSEGTRIAASPFTVMDTYSALWLINAIIVLRLEFRIPC